MNRWGATRSRASGCRIMQVLIAMDLQSAGEIGARGGKSPRVRMS